MAKFRFVNMAIGEEGPKKTEKMMVVYLCTCLNDNMLPAHPAGFVQHHAPVRIAFLMEDWRVGESLVPRRLLLQPLFQIPSVAIGADATCPKQDGTLLLQPLFQIPPWLLGQMLHAQSKTARSCYSRSSRSLRGYWGRCYVPKARRHGHLLEVAIGGQAGGKQRGANCQQPEYRHCFTLFSFSQFFIAIQHERIGFAA
jgi:hypothetical protein